MHTVTSSYDTEQSLVASMLSGRKEALYCLYRKYSPLLMGFILEIIPDKKVAEEVLQKAFIEIWKRKKEYQPDIDRLFIWMLRITRKQAVLKAGAQNITNKEIPNSNISVN